MQPVQAHPTAPPTRRRRSWLVMALAVLTLLFVVGAGGTLFYFHLRAQKLAGLEGTWRDPADPKHSYQFRSNGNVDAWWESLPMGNFMTWSRDGNTITIHSERAGDFVGQLEGNEIRGQTTIRDHESGKAIQTQDTVWRRE